MPKRELVDWSLVIGGHSIDIRWFFESYSDVYRIACYKVWDGEVSSLLSLYFYPLSCQWLFASLSLVIGGPWSLVRLISHSSFGVNLNFNSTLSPFLISTYPYSPNSPNYSPYFPHLFLGWNLSIARRRSSLSRCV